MKKFIAILVIILFILTSNAYTYAQVSCSANGVVTCANGATPFCSLNPDVFPLCSDGYPICCSLTICPLFNLHVQCPTPTPPPVIPVILVPVPVLPTTYKCDPGYTSCPNNTSSLCCLNGCCPSNPNQCKCQFTNECYPNCTPPAPTYTCDPGYISCPDNMTLGSCCPATVGCCPSNPTQCKCSNSNQCTPNCIAPAPPPTTYTCNPGYTTCPPNIAPTDPNGACCLYGCCPSNPNQCLCSSTSNQCGPNCSVSTPSGGSSTNNPPINTSPVNNNNPQIEITGINSINPFAGLKRYTIYLTVTGTNFESGSECSLYPRIAGLGIRVQPSSFVLEPKSSLVAKVTIPSSRNLKKLRTLTFKATCDNGAKAQKDITITASGSPSTGNGSPPSSNSNVSPSQIVISVSGVPKGTTGLAIPVTVDTSVIKLGSATSSVSNAFAVTGSQSDGVGIISTGNSLPSSFTITVPLIGIMSGSSTFTVGAVVNTLGVGGSIIPGASASANVSSVVVH